MVLMVKQFYLWGFAYTHGILEKREGSRGKWSLGLRVSCNPGAPLLVLEA
jgi:hypothetical protein